MSPCSQGKGRIWREQLRSLSRTERAGLVEDCGSVLRVDLAALAQVMGKREKTNKNRVRTHQKGKLLALGSNSPAEPTKATEKS